jgi:hypothetical protein
MTYRENIIKDYIEGYNQFDIEKMVSNMDDNIVFENIQNGNINMNLIDLTAFRNKQKKKKGFA